MTWVNLIIQGVSSIMPKDENNSGIYTLQLEGLKGKRERQRGSAAIRFDLCINLYYKVD